MSTNRQAPGSSRPPTRPQLRQRAVRKDSDDDGADLDNATVTLTVEQTQAAIAIQDLSSATRSRITESDTSRIRTVPVYVLQNARECNRPGTKAAAIAQTNRASLAFWADFGRTANARADVEELCDINSGQTHRGRLNDVVEFEKQKNGGELDWDAADIYGYRREHEAMKAKEVQNKSSGKGGAVSRFGGRGGGTAGRAGRGGSSSRGGGRAGGVAGTDGRNIIAIATALSSSNRVTSSPRKGASHERQSTDHLGRDSSHLHDRPADPAVDPGRSYGYSGKGGNMIPYTTGGNATGLDPALARHHTKDAVGRKAKSKTPGNARAPQPRRRAARVPPQLPAWWSAANLATNTPAGFGTRNGVDTPNVPFSANSSNLSTTSISPVFRAPPQQIDIPIQDDIEAQAASTAQTAVQVQGLPFLGTPPVGDPTRTHFVPPTQTSATTPAISRAQTSTSTRITARTDELASPADFMEAVNRKQTHAQRVVPTATSKAYQVAKTAAQPKMKTEISTALTQQLSRENIREVPVSEIHFPPPHRSDARHGEASSWTDGQPSPVSFTIQSERSSMVPSPLPSQDDFLLLSADNAGSHGPAISIPTVSTGSGRENVAKSPTGESIDLMNMEVDFVSQPTLIPDLPCRSNQSLQEDSQPTADKVDQVSARMSQLSLSIPFSTTIQPRFLGFQGACGAMTTMSTSDFTEGVRTTRPLSQTTDSTSISPYEHQVAQDRRSQLYLPEPLQSVDPVLNQGGQDTGQVTRKAPTSARRYSPEEMVEIGNNVRIAIPSSSKSNKTVRQMPYSESIEANLIQGFPNKVRAKVIPTTASPSTSVSKKPSNPFRPFLKYNTGPESNKRNANSSQHESVQDQENPLGYITAFSNQGVDTSRIRYPETDIVDNQNRNQEKLIQLMNSGPGAGMTPFGDTEPTVGDRREDLIQKCPVSRALATLSTNGISPRKLPPATSRWKNAKDTTVARQNWNEEQQPKPVQENLKDAIIGDQKLIQRSSNTLMSEVPARATISVHASSRSGLIIPDWLTKEVTRSGNKGIIGQRNGLVLPNAAVDTSPSPPTPTVNPQLTAMPYNSHHSQTSQVAKAFGVSEDDNSDESEL